MKTPTSPVGGHQCPDAPVRRPVRPQTPPTNIIPEPDMPLEDRVNNILSLLTPEEKIALLSQRPGWSGWEFVP